MLYVSPARIATQFSVHSVLRLAVGGGTSRRSTPRDWLESSLITDGLEHPWGMAFLPNGDLLVTERPGGYLSQQWY